MEAIAISLLHNSERPQAFLCKRTIERTIEYSMFEILHIQTHKASFYLKGETFWKTNTLDGVQEFME